MRDRLAAIRQRCVAADASEAPKLIADLAGVLADLIDQCEAQEREITRLLAEKPKVFET